MSFIADDTQSRERADRVFQLAQRGWKNPEKAPENPVRSSFRRQGDTLPRPRRKYSHDILNKNRAAFFGLGFVLALAICHLIP